MSRIFIHIDMDAFFVSVERVLDPSLEGKPVIVGGDPEGRGVVASASYEARARGVHSAMPLGRAKQLCPDAIFIRGRHGAYSDYSARVRRIIDDYSPLVEMVSIDEAYIDCSGMERLHGSPLEIARRIRDRIARELRLPSSAGIASSMLVAKVASDAAKPNGMLEVPPGKEAEFLAPMPISKLPGIGPQTASRLKSYGFRTIGDIARAGEEGMASIFGEQGKFLATRARGIDNREIVTDGETKSVSREHTFEHDMDDKEYLMSTLLYLSEKVAAALRHQGLMAKTVTLKMRFEDFSTITRAATLSSPDNSDVGLFRAIESLFGGAWRLNRKIRLLGVAASNLSHGEIQTDFLSASQAESSGRLMKTIDRLKEKYGFHSILRAGSLSKEEQSKKVEKKKTPPQNDSD